MSDDEQNIISETNKSYLEEIAKQLFSHHAAVMVGAGFSKNAVPNNPKCNKFADWSELGDLFYTKIYGHLPTENQKYLNVLRLANEVEAAFGRPALDSMLKQAIPDLDYSPSDLHQKLLMLPWEDVFTTNYDTLLERSAENIIDYKYTLVLNKEDLICSSKPRIIKLHGSFPSVRPFIITEEDYRRYPKEFAPFVNTVQQSLLENTLCLIGFSGDDPNFLRWIGWIRDNLGNNVTKIYLIGVFSFSDAQIKLFAQRNIIVVNLIPDKKDTNPHYHALNYFLDFLQNRKNNANFSKWPFTNSDFIQRPTSEITREEIVKITEQWRKQRVTYPGWIVLPEEKREGFYIYTDYWIFPLINNKDVLIDEKINFYYELLWRLNLCLYPITNDIANEIESLLNNCKSNDEKISFFYLKLLESYRQNGRNDDWQRIAKEFEEKKSYFSIEVFSEYMYEKTLHALFCLDYNKIKECLTEWKIDHSQPFMNAKKAGILAETGEIIAAEHILREAIFDIRKLQNNSVNSSDITLLSQESYIVDLYQNVVSSYPYKMTDADGINQRKVYEDYIDRLIVLKRYLCDPREEQRYFKSALSEEYVEQKLQEVKQEFDINSNSIIRHMGKNTKEQRKAYSLLLFIERTGCPINIHEGSCIHNIYMNETKAAIERIADYSLFWSISICCRVANEKLVDKLFTREKISNFSSEYVNSLCMNMINTLDENYDNINQEKKDYKTNFAQTLSIILPEIISRLCCKINSETKKKVLQLVISIYESPYRHYYRNLNKVTQRLIESFSISEQIQIFPDIIKLKIPFTFAPIELCDLVPPCRFIDFKNFHGSKNKQIIIPEDDILQYIEASKSEIREIRNWGLNTLWVLDDLKLLNEKLLKQYINVLWNKTDSNGFPANVNLLRISFLNLPHKKNINVVALFKKYILNFSLPIYNETTIGVSYRQDMVEDYFKEIYLSEKYICWNETELVVILQKMKSFWNGCKELLNKETDLWGERYIYEECLIMKRALCMLFLSEKYRKLSKEAAYFIEEFVKYNIPCIELKIVGLPDANMNLLKQNAVNSLAFDDENQSVDAIHAMCQILTKTISIKKYRSLYQSTLYEFTLCLLYTKNRNLLNYIELYAKMVNEKVIILSSKIETVLLQVLINLKEETEMVDSLQWPYETKILIRTKTANLAYDLFLLYKENKKNIPQIVLQWQKICKSDAEFVEVRNAWIE